MLEEISGDVQSSFYPEQVQLDEVAQSHVQLSLGISKEEDSTSSGKLVLDFKQPHGEKLHNWNIAGLGFSYLSVFLPVVTLYSAWYVLSLSSLLVQKMRSGNSHINHKIFSILNQEAIPFMTAVLLFDIKGFLVL